MVIQKVKKTLLFSFTFVTNQKNIKKGVFFMFYIKDLIKKYWKYIFIPFIPILICLFCKIIGVN